MDKKVLKEAGIAEDEFKKLSEEWNKDSKALKKEYLDSPEGRLMEAIYGKKN